MAGISQMRKGLCHIGAIGEIGGSPTFLQWTSLAETQERISRAARGGKEQRGKENKG
jgi:hypothetical protein